MAQPSEGAQRVRREFSPTIGGGIAVHLYPSTEARSSSSEGSIMKRRRPVSR